MGRSRTKKNVIGSDSLELKKGTKKRNKKTKKTETTTKMKCIGEDDGYVKEKQKLETKTVRRKERRKKTTRYFTSPSVSPSSIRYSIGEAGRL